MFDRQLLAVARPAVNAVGGFLAARGVSANTVSFVGFGFGILAALMIGIGMPLWALLPLLLNRLCDGLDGAVARLGKVSDRGAFLDITLDFLFYAAVPLAFAVHDPSRNALAMAVLLAAFIGTGVSFLAYAIMAEKRGDKSTAYPSKGFYYLGGLTEGFETVLCFVLMCLFPQQVWVIGFGYAALCGVTTVTRMVAGWRRFGPS